LSDESLFREVDEEVRQEQYKKLWERYGNYALALCVVVVAAVAGFKGWQYWQVKQAEAAGEMFFAAVRQAEAGDHERALANLAAIRHPGYGLLGRLRQAGVLAAQGKAAEALAIYDAVAGDAGAGRALRELAQMRAGYLLAETATPDELKARVGGFDAPGNVWRHAVREMMGIAAWRGGDYGLAARYAGTILADPEAPSGMRRRAEMLSQLAAPLQAKK
jgi:hypothetical protein